MNNVAILPYNTGAQTQTAMPAEQVQPAKPCGCRGISTERRLWNFLAVLMVIWLVMNIVGFISNRA